MEVKLTVNGKEVELTAEQLKLLGLEEKNQFKRCEYGDVYYHISSIGKPLLTREAYFLCDTNRYLAANYCTDKELMTKRARQEILNRLLWRFTMENGWSDDLWKDDTLKKYYVTYERGIKNYYVDYCFIGNIPGVIYFSSQQIAQRAIDEIIIPFEKGELEVCKIWGGGECK